MESTLDEQQVEKNPTKRKKRNGRREHEKRKTQQEQEHQEKMARKAEKRKLEERAQVGPNGEQSPERRTGQNRRTLTRNLPTWRGRSRRPWLRFVLLRRRQVLEIARSEIEPWMTDGHDADSSTTITGFLLDLVARFFARATKRESGPARDQRPAKGLGQCDGHSNGKGRRQVKDRLVTYIAKNGGPPGFRRQKR